jgi:hypothetical protein
MYISSLEVTCLPASVFLKLLFPCAALEVVYVYRCFKARRDALPRVSRPLYLQSPPNARLRLFAPALMPPTRFLCSHGVWYDLPPGAAAAALRRDAAIRERCSARANRRAY